MNIQTFILDMLVGVKKSVSRFLIVWIFAIAATITGITLAHFDIYEGNVPEMILRVLSSLLLGVLFALAGQLYIEQTQKVERSRILIQIGTVLIPILFFFFYSDMMLEPHLNVQTRYVAWMIVGVFAVFSAFCAKPSSALSFWNNAKQLVYAFLLSGFFSGITYVGIVIAYFAIGQLFDVSLSSQWYADTFAIISGIIFTELFLSRLPKPADAQTVPLSYPKELKILGLYILAPLVLLYFVILYIYTGVALVTSEWPNGLISTMIIWFSFFSILLFLILYPYLLERGVERKISKAFFILLIPQIAVLFWAVFVRIGEYGVTENRYLVVALGIYLLAIALYFIFSKAQNVRVVPVSLALVAFFISFGPWGMFSVSERSQTNRLEKLFAANGMFVDGNVVAATGDVSDGDSQEMYEVLVYLDRVHGYEAIEAWFDEDVTDKSANEILANLNIESRFPVYEYGESVKRFYILEGEAKPVVVTGYKYIFPIESDVKITLPDGRVATYYLDHAESKIVFEVESGPQFDEVDLKPFLSNLPVGQGENASYLTQDQLTFQFKSSLDYGPTAFMIKLVIKSIATNNDQSIAWITGDVLLAI